MNFSFLKLLFQRPADSAAAKRACHVEEHSLSYNERAIASQDYSGYTRERAVREWATHKEPIAVWFLIDRLSDWVPQVRSAAWNTLQLYMTPEYHSQFFERFYWIDRLLSKGNIDSVRFGEELVSFVLSFAFSPELERHLKDHDIRNWNCYVKHAIHGLLKTDHTLLKIVCNDSSLSIRSAAIRVFDDLQEDQRETILTDMIRDPAQPIRIRALYYVVKHIDREGYEQKIYRTAADVSPSIRETARFYLCGKITDWRAYYWERLDSDQLADNLKINRRQTLGCLGGFTEFAVDADLPLLEQIIQIDDNKAKTIALETIYRLNLQRGIALAKEFVLNPSGQLRHCSIRILSQNLTPETLMIARSLVGSQSNYLRISGLRLLGKISGWTIAADLLLATSDVDENVREKANVLLNQWMCTFAVQGWDKPKTEESNRVLAAVKLIRSRNTTVLPDTIKKILFFFGVRDANS